LKVALNKNIKFERIYILLISLVLFWLGLQARLYIVQIKNHDYYVQQSQLQSEKKIVLPAKRGEIFDRNHAALATNLEHYDIGLDMNHVQNTNAIITACSKAFNTPREEYRAKLRTDKDFVFLARKVSQEKSIELEKIQDAGLVLLPAYRRYYPYGFYGSQVIGFTDVDDKGISGIEMHYESLLKGEEGWTTMVVDARRRFRYDVDQPGRKPVPGMDITLTIDKDYQTIVEDELRAGVIKSNAGYGIAVLLDPNSGEVLAMGSYPTFNPNSPQSSTLNQRKNRAITDVFEPGSTFKVFSAAALLQEGIKKQNDIVFCEQGAFKFYSHVIHDTKRHGWLSLRGVIEHSSNIGMVKLISELPSLTFFKYLKSFGFDAHTGIGISGESSGLLTHPRAFSGLSKGVISFGQEVGVTALQITNAFCVLVNGGVLMKPYLVMRVMAQDGTIVEENEPESIRRVITPEVSQTLKNFMHGVVERGTGKRAATAVIPVGGKTGTAQKYNKRLRSYRKGGYLASFIGFAPYDNPRFVLGVFIDEPKPAHTGGKVAAPVFAKIIERIYAHTPIDESESDNAPSSLFAQKNSHLPVLTGLTLPAAEELLEMRNISFNPKGEGRYIKQQVLENDDLILHLGDATVTGSRIPNLYGLSLREALKKINFARVRVKITGSGKVIKQSIAPGSSYHPGSTLYLTCRRD
jgi:cell division protein FtsI (penicillin-binding protein 3)